MAQKPPDRPALRRHKCCMGALYYSQALMDSRMEPVCAGIRQTHKGGEDLGELQTEASNLVDFKYMCVGYSIYDEERMRRQPSRDDPASGVDLPYCEGLEIVSSRNLQGNPVLLKEGIEGPAGAPPSTQEPAPKRKNSFFPGSGSTFVSEPGGVNWGKLPERFQKSSFLILQKMQQNAGYLATSMKRVIERISDIGKG
ncbi:unnamed protein product [Ostreobium quekettii]|uniref:DUF8204 domain-containing protein n=1 Tax=Ostreobium quekettii TaxID=121088 RepID=A0A8S1J1N4_9CHLO|nr:unnamed protein product [Ostreobium quekettii]|eukprot:evm.model.scf_230.3 EVM.evm.TU.scf_230.3   scf_230:50903-53565(+)